MALDQVFLRQIQRAGWTILAADEARVLCGCPRDGCDVRLSLRPDGYIPQTSGKGPDYADVMITNFEDARLFLRRRRESLAYTIREVEEVAGIAVDYLAKFEKDDPSKIPNAMTFIEWAQALGYDVVLRPGKLTPNALRVLAETRDKLQQRRTKFRIHRARRASRS